MQSVAAVLVLPAFSGSYITTLATVAWQVQHAAMSSSLVVLLQLTVLMYLCFQKMTLAPGSGGALGSAWNKGTPRLLGWQAWHLETSTFVSRGVRGTW